MSDAMTIALLGQPNSGKSTLYNALTGARQHVGNWPGKTVEKCTGSFRHGGRNFNVADLPGTYSLAANSDEEVVTRDYIASGEADLVCLLADASQLERSLFMLADYVGIRVPAALILNMMDVAGEQGKEVSAESIESKLGIPVLPFVASQKKNYGAFYELVGRREGCGKIASDTALASLYEQEFGDDYRNITALLPEGGVSVYEKSWLFAKLVEHDPVAEGIVRAAVPAQAYEKMEGIRSGIQNGSSRTGNCKFRWIDTLLEGAVTARPASSTRKSFDRVALSKHGGKWLAVGIILVSLVLSILVGYPLMAVGSMLPAAGAPLSQWMSGIGVHPLLVSLICEALLTAVSFTIMMCGYIFGATLVFSLMEDIGYMARVSYVFDGTMRRLGLHGKAVMPFLVSFGCNIAGSSGSRVLDSWGQRMTAIAMSWVVPCGSTWAVVGLVSTVFFGVPGAAVIIALLFAVSLLHLRLTARVYGSRFLSESDRTGLIMELPPYHKPHWGALIKTSLVRMWEAFKRAIGIVTVISVVLCLLSYSSGDASNSILYRFGSAIEPVTLFFGLRWQTFIAWMASWMGKEGALGALASVFGGRSVMSAVAGMSLSSPDSASVGAALASVLTKPEALAFIFAFYFNMPCVMSLSATIHETHSLKWPLRIALYYIGVSLLLACVVYHAALLVL